MVTLLPAEGGAGKTMLEHAACVAVAADRMLMGKTVSAGAAAGLFAEDSADVLHGRHERICREYTIDPAAIAPTASLPPTLDTTLCCGETAPRHSYCRNWKPT
jgi:RecA-family ATPase